jgi:drug/metabolite transporter (DMT)-like permease
MNSSFDQIQPSKTDPRFCTSCGRDLVSGAVVCAYCTKPVAASQIPTVVSEFPSRVSDFVRATGRTRKAGYWLFGGGIATILSAFFPWVSLDGIESTRPSGAGVVVLLAVGGLLAYFGSRILQDRITKRASIALWILAAVDIVLCIALFAAAANVNRQVGGGIQPSSGFLIGIAGLIAGVVGTVLVHTVRRKKEAAGLVPEDGRSPVAGA